MRIDMEGYPSWCLDFFWKCLCPSWPANASPATSPRRRLYAARPRMRFSDPDDKSSFIPVNYGVTNADLQFSPYITAQHHGSPKHSPSLPSLQYVFPPTKYIIIHSQRISPHLHPPCISIHGRGRHGSYGIWWSWQSGGHTFWRCRVGRDLNRMGKDARWIWFIFILCNLFLFLFLFCVINMNINININRM